ncbi:hypothetical protein [Gandjariella thermophila]|uniref:NERD domain-containing protein n=1 Tax=Gandjariella thermophila TaxID=1931992 RepID=A0A4D4J7E8_9PSEU|nr:hypothetical protein [Gandjariella thermophila]GDY30446.1 hypothetical protein GTS_20790 [Gandjariella thermophila]
MRLVRLGEPPSEVSADIRAALATWGGGNAVQGGLGLLGVQPPDCPPVDAIVVLPRGVLVVVGVDLPDPAVRLEAPLDDRWAIDGWPLTRQDGVVNPAAEALQASAAVAARLQAMRAEPLPVSTVIAVGPYVAQVMQPSADLHRGVRVLHPSSTTLLAAARELATCDRPCPADAALQVVAALGVDPATVGDPLAEGFPDAAASPLATASTMLIPRVPAKPTAPYPTAPPASHPVPPVPPTPPAPPARRGNPRRLAFLAVAVIALLLLAGVVVAVSSAHGADGSAPVPVRAVVGGTTFTRQDLARDPDCAAHAYGDLRVWLGQHPCTEMRRALYGTTAANRSVSVAVSVVDFADAGTAQAFQQAADATGAGGISDLVREGRRPRDAAASFDNAAYASEREATEVRLALAVWTEGGSRPDDATLRQLATQALQLPAPS